MQPAEVPDDIPPFRTWAPWARAIWKNGFHTHKDHFQFWQFLWVNGVRPMRCSYLCWTRYTGDNRRNILYQNRQFERYAQDPDLRKRYLLQGRVWDCYFERPKYLGGSRTERDMHGD